MPSPSRKDLLSAVDGFIASLQPGLHVNTVRSADDAAYAAYVFGLVLRAASGLPGTRAVDLRSISSPSAPLRAFIVRGAPGYIFSSVNDYGYSVFECNRNRYEIHLGVQYFGSSGVLHEFDISIIKQADADEARRNYVNPGSGRACIVFECKFYSGNLGIRLGREFVGLLADFPSVKAARLATNAGPGSVRAYLASRVKYSLSDELVPGNPQAETQFINALIDDMRNRLL